jgi:hypothetical protein
MAFAHPGITRLNHRSREPFKRLKRFPRLPFSAQAPQKVNAHRLAGEASEGQIETTVLVVTEGSHKPQGLSRRFRCALILTRLEQNR